MQRLRKPSRFGRVLIVVTLPRDHAAVTSAAPVAIALGFVIVIWCVIAIRALGLPGTSGSGRGPIGGGNWPL